jgi:L-ascorbate metabolism protein UlaG (beta-lactamase superfamily)
VSRGLRRALRVLFWTPFVALAGALALGRFVLAVPGHRGSVTDHFDGRRFRNPGPEHGRGEFWDWFLDRRRGPWPEFEDAPPAPRPPRAVSRGDLRVTFVNHSTVLVQMDGVNVLTDPVWSERVGPWNLVGPRRHRPPGLRFEDLPPIDAVLVSHDHYDHLDLPTLRRLAARDPECPVLAPLGNRVFLAREGIARAEDLDWWEERRLAGGVRVTCVPARHFSGRGLGDRNASLWGGFVLRGSAGSVYFAGDTGDGPHVEEIARRMGPFRLACLPIGAYRPLWFMSAVHLNPVEAVDVAHRLGARTSLAIHFGTFAQADDGDREPTELLEEALRTKTGREVRFWALRNGESRDVPP